MFVHPRLIWRAVASSVLCILVLAALPALAADKMKFRVDDYQIDAELTPHSHKIAARARVKFTALEDINSVIFQLHNGLRVTKVTDESGKSLEPERITQEFAVRVQLNQSLSKDQSSTLTFDYDGDLSSADDSPVQGLKLASVNDDTSYLLYAGRWFPVNAFGINRFTATINVSVPPFMMAIGSGKQSSSTVAGRAAKGAFPFSSGNKVFTFIWDKPSFPGTIVAGAFNEFKTDEAGLDLHVFFKPTHQDLGAMYEETAIKEFTYFITLYGQPLSTTLRIVELPDDTLPATWAPEMACIASRAITQKTNYRLLANTIAHQWWGVSVSPKSIDDWWLSDGFSRYAEARYVEQAAGSAGLQEVVKDMSVGALAYDTVPLATASKLDMFSPEFQSLVTDKGAMVLHMLRWVEGEQKYDKTMRDFYTQYSGKPASLDDFQTVAENDYGDKLTWFFSQWLNSTGAPEFKTKYTVYRIGTRCPPQQHCAGFRIVGQINQDLDLFRMPVELRIDTDGRTEEKKIDVVGTDSAFTIETFGRPRKISIDPQNEVLKNSPEIRLRASIMRGQALVQQGDFTGALAEFNKALDSNKNSSLAHYRVAEVFFLQKNYQASANAYRESLNGDGDPRWTEVWSHVQLGKIFDVTGQRERATNEYRQALQTNDNTQGALDEARKYLQKAYEQPKNG